MNNKNCLFCQNFKFIQADGGYFEYTPGEDIDIGCYKGKWQLEIYDDTEDSYRQKMLTATTCEDFAERESK